jgi:hypothetical protein
MTFVSLYGLGFSIITYCTNVAVTDFSKLYYSVFDASYLFYSFSNFIIRKSFKAKTNIDKNLYKQHYNYLSYI